MVQPSGGAVRSAQHVRALMMTMLVAFGAMMMANDDDDDWGRHGHLIKHIGVKRTFTRSFERFSLLGSLIYTTSLFKTIHTLFGKTYFLFNLIYTLIYAHFLYLSILYNRGLPHPCQKREYLLPSLMPAFLAHRMFSVRRFVIHWPAMIGFVWVMSMTSYVWGKELKVSILSGDRYAIVRFR